jgi:hypothetical protein
MPIVRLISICLKFSFSCVWISSSQNVFTDAGSRFQFTKLLQLAPHLLRKSSPPKSRLIGMKQTLTSLDKLTSTSGMGLHPAIKKPILQDNGLTVRASLLTSPGQILPATPHGILEWIAYLGDRGITPKTIKSYLSSVRSLHVDACLPFDSCESPTIQRVILGIKRYYGERQRIPKMPITLHILQQLHGDPSLLGEANFDTVIKLAWAGFLRSSGEFTLSNGEKLDSSIHLTRSAVEFIPNISQPNHRLVLPASKTDPFQKGVAILTLRAPSSAISTCAVSAFQHLFQMVPQPTSLHLFSDGSGAPLTRSSFISSLKSRLSQIGLDSSAYSGHSFRRGAASSAATIGYSDYEIQLLGRWRSDGIQTLHRRPY